MHGRIGPRVRAVQATSSCWVTLLQEEGEQQQQPSFPGFYCMVWVIWGLVFITMRHQPPAEPHGDTGAAGSLWCPQEPPAHTVNHTSPAGAIAMGQGFGDAGEPCTRAAGPQRPRRDILPPAPSPVPAGGTRSPSPCPRDS